MTRVPGNGTGLERKGANMTQSSRILLTCLPFLIGTLTVHPVATAQTASDYKLIAADPSFQTDEPDDLKIKGLSIQSVGRQIGARILRRLTNRQGLIEKPWVLGGGNGDGDVSRNVLVNDPALDTIQRFPGFLPFEFSTQSETSVAVFGNDVLIGYNSSANQPIVNIGGTLFFEHRFWSAYSISHDGGRTFTSGFVPPTPNSPVTLGDPSVAVDRAGHFFYVSIALITGADGQLHFGVQINRSDDSGNTFGTGVPVIVEDFADKAGLTIGPDPKVSSRDNLYITWTRLTSSGGEIWLSRSTDGGATWSSKPLFQPVADTINSSVAAWSAPVVDSSSGRLYVAFNHYSNIDADNVRVLVSDDAGETFHFLAFNVPGAVDAFAYPNVWPGIFNDCGPDGFRNVLHQGADAGGGRFGVARYRQATRLLPLPATAAFNGRFFIAFNTSTSKLFGDPTAGSEINLLYSADGGVTWAPTFKVAGYTTAEPHHVLPAVALTQNGSHLLVSYYVQQISERLRTDIARLSVEGNQLRLDGAQKLSSTTFNLTPNNIPFPVPGDPFFTVSYDLGFTTCYDIGEYQSIGVSRRPGDESGPIVAAWGDNRRIWKSPSDSTAPGVHAQADVFSSRLDDDDRIAGGN